ncbi:hypothetical protein [Actinoallomurus iriomotensis]|uniref:hypothetical protein n=1 Tax=Actinoallomurus iriomotensis TaxID=478107 RepID=UPI0025566BD3|nr:hypothetical protein [Actinoallomurus iriomotensis]
MTAEPETSAEQDRRPRRRNVLAITAATFAVLAGLMTFNSLSYRPAADIGTDYAAGRMGAPALFAIIALACGVPALLRTRRPADRNGRSWDGREPATVAVVVACLVTVVAAVRIALLVTSR